MKKLNWQEFLAQESRKTIDVYQQVKSKKQQAFWAWYFELPSEVISSEWLGFPGASESQIVATEARLGLTLPSSYRDFLKVTNGWHRFPGILRLRFIEEIDWFCVENQDWIDEWISIFQNEKNTNEEYFIYRQNGDPWEQAIRTEYMQTALQISEEDDGDVVLLNPQVIHDDEWEAWILSSGRGGANRFPSFQEMLQTIGLVDPWT